MAIGLTLGLSLAGNTVGDSTPAAPTDISLSATSVDENAGLGSIVASISANGSPASTFTIQSDPDNKFDISGSNLILDGALDYGTATSHSVTIRASNGEGSPYDEAFTINVIEVGGGDVAPTFVNLSNQTISESVPVGTVVGIITSDGTAPVTFFEHSDADNKFEVVGNELRTTAAFDYQTATSHGVLIGAQNSVDSFIQAFSITVTEASSIVMGFQASQDEGTNFDFIVDNVNGNDSNSGTSVGQAKATISGAVAVAPSNSTIGIRNQGVDYHEQVDTLTPFTDSGIDNITLSGYGTEKPVLKGSVPLTGAVVCTAGDESIVGPNYASIYKVTNVAKTSFVDDDPFNAALLEDDDFMMIVMGRQPNPRFRNIESYNLDWLEADVTNTTTVFNTDRGENVEVIVSHTLEWLSKFTQAQVENCDIRFHRAPNGATRVPVQSFDVATRTVTLQRDPAWDAWDQEYESNVYKDRFALVNLLPEMQKGEWGFFDNGDGTVNLYYWPSNPANVNTAIEYCDIDTLILARNAATSLRSMVIKNTSATQGVGSTTPVRLDGSVGGGARAPFTVHNCLLRNSMNKGDGYGLIYSRMHSNYEISQNTLEHSRNAFGMFATGGNYDTSDGRTVGGLITRNIIQFADKSPCRVYGHIGNIVARNWLLYSGLAAHANKCNHYEGGHLTLWAHNIGYGCSGYATWQEASSQDWIGNWLPCNFNGGRALVDQNRDSGFSSWASNQGINGDCYILNNEFAPSPEAITGMTALAIAALGNLPLETAVKFIVKNNIAYGIDVTDEPQMVAEGSNYYTDNTTRVVSDVADDYGDVYENILEGDYSIKSTSPTRSQAGADLSTIEVDGGSTTTLSARWPTYDFTKDINGDTWDISAPGVGAMTNPDNFPAFDPFWVERPTMTGAPTTGLTLTMSTGVLMTVGTRPTLTYQWCTATDPYAHPDDWTNISGATSSSYVVTASEEGLYIGCKVTGGAATDQVIQTVVTTAAYPLSIGSLLIEDHKDNTDQVAGTWEESGTFTTDGTPLLIVLPAHISAGSDEMSPEVTIGTQGRTNGTGTAAVMIADANIAQRSSNHAYLGIITNPGTGTMTLQYRSTTQETDSMGIYAWAAPGLASFGANGTLVGTSSGASLASNITTTNPNSIALTILARQAISGNPVEVDTYANSTTVMIQNGYSGLQENTNSALFSLAYQLSPSTGAYSETITFGDTRASGAIMTELVGAA